MENEDEQPKVQFVEGFVFVNVYELSQGYGGPEEGGWWVTCGSLILSRQVPAGDVEQVQAELEAEYPTAEQQKAARYFESLDETEYVRFAPIYRYTDVNYYGGDYRVYVEDQPGADFPQEWPHYE
jgi:hypothetical protein